MLKPFFTFFGGKYRCAPHYPKPQTQVIVEPFAGSAGYSVRYPDCKVVLVERDPKIAATWRYLLTATRDDILSLPDLRPGETVSDLNIPPDAKLLVGFWCSGGSAQPRNKPSPWMLQGGRNKKSYWGAWIRDRIANQLGQIRHWELIEGDYTTAPDIEATWFIDPPYVTAGENYRFGSKLLDYTRLGSWCTTRKGQVMVCENVGATWLPFSPFREIQARSVGPGIRVSKEALWYSPMKGVPPNQTPSRGTGGHPQDEGGVAQVAPMKSGT